MKLNKFIKILLTILVLSSGLLSPSPVLTGQSMPPDTSLIPLNSEQGRRSLCEGGAAEPFWALSQYYSPQPDLGSCSVGSSTMVLNALLIDRPISSPHAPYRLFTSDNFFTPGVEAIAPRRKVSGSGMTLEVLARCLRTFPVDVRCVWASEAKIEDFRALLREKFTRPGSHLLVNYDRKTLGQAGGGHISPLGAYDQRRDLVLILDTANYRYPWVWVKVDTVWRAMATTDDASDRSRGYLVVSAKPRD